MIRRFLYVIIAILILALMFKIVKRSIKKISFKDFNKFLLNNRNTVENKHFVNENTGNAYMINTYNGNLFYCTKINKTLGISKMKKEHSKYVESCNPDDFIKICDDYYKLIDKDIYFDIESLKK